MRFLIWAAMVLTPLAAAAPYAQQTNFGDPAPLIQAAQAQTQVPSSWERLPDVRAGRLATRVIEVAPFDELVPSWNVAGPADRALTVEVRVRRTDGRWTPYFGFGTWRAAGGRASPPVVQTVDGTLNTDALALPFRAQAYQARVTLDAGLELTLLSFNTSDRALRLRDLGRGGQAAAWNTRLAVPAFSQMIYPDGGEVWCSPTSVAMLLGYWKRPVRVPDAALATYDQTYDGFGNWPFNTAYAATRGLQALVTRLGSLRDAEAFVRRGLPLALSVRFKAGELPGAPLSWSNGHLLVLTGFDAQGNPRVNDPAARRDAEVKRSYPRAIFERLWLSHSGGMAYVMAPRP